LFNFSCAFWFTFCYDTGISVYAKGFWTTQDWTKFCRAEKPNVINWNTWKYYATTQLFFYQWSLLHSTVKTIHAVFNHIHLQIWICAIILHTCTCITNIFKPNIKTSDILVWCKTDPLDNRHCTSVRSDRPMSFA
jgi:hypothetical protein